MTPRKLTQATALIGCLALLGISAVAMAGRVAEWNDRNDTPQHPGSYHFERNVDWSPTLTAPGLAGTTLRFEERGKGATPEGEPWSEIAVKWGESELVLRAIAPPLRGFKDMSAYEESLAVLTFVPVVRGEMQSAAAARAVIVNRRTDYDPTTWGAVRVKDWWFEVVELLPGGRFGPTRLMQFPAPRDPQGRAPAQIPDPQTGAVPNPAVETIQERSWEWTAALHAVPKGQVSRLRFKTTAVSAMGWTLPTAGGAILGAIVFGAMLLGDRVAARRKAPAVVTPA